MMTESNRTARAVMAVLVSVFGVVACVVGVAARADAAVSYSDLGYPWVDATTLNASTFDWGYTTCPASDPNCKKLLYPPNHAYGEADPWVYYLRNCTSWAAFRLHQLGVPDSA